MALSQKKSRLTKAGENIKLPTPQQKSTVSLEETIARRRSVRSFTRKALTMEQIGQLLWATQGITDKVWELRAAPSAGALFPLEIFVVLPEGVYHYDPHQHALKRTIATDQRRSLQSAALEQEFVSEAPAVFVIAAVHGRTSRKYGERAGRYVDLEVGHAGQNLLLQATALGLAGVPVGAFYDDRVAETLGLKKNMKPVYIVPIGHPAE